jgi:hypothetical protein
METKMSKPSTFSRIITAIAIIAAIALGILGVLYLLASAIMPSRLWVGITLLGISLIIAFFAYKSLAKPKPITVQWSSSGPLKPEELKCPNCGATLKVDDPNKTRVVCQYCGRLVEIVEEPKW